MGKRSVCIVDDDKIFRFTTEKYLHYVPEVSGSRSFKLVSEALEFFRENLDNPDELPDILLLDVNMPVLDGWDFVEEFQEIKDQLPKRIYIFMVSSSIDERDSKRAIESQDILDYVVKPLNETRLKELVHKTIKD